MNKILCFDTSYNNCSVSIAIGQKIIAFEHESKPSVQAEKLLVMIESVLKKSKTEYKDLEYLAVVTGPGSFTGIRIALAAARGIIHAASNIKGLGITGFEAVYYRLSEQVFSFDYAIVLLNAYRDMQYIQIFDGDGAISEPKLVLNEEVPEIIRSYAGTVICGGNGLIEVYDKLESINKLIILPRFKTIKASSIARLANDKINDNKIVPIEPLYIRSTL